jgi:hypothetical protein
VSLGEIGVSIAIFGFLAIFAAWVFAVLLSQPFKIFILLILSLVVGTLLVMTAGFLSSQIVSFVFSIEDTQATIAIGVVGSICASLVAILIGLSFGLGDLEEKLDLIATRIGDPSASPSVTAVMLSEADRLQALELFAAKGQVHAIKHIRTVTNCSVEQARATFDAIVPAG